MSSRSKCFAYNAPVMPRILRLLVAALIVLSVPVQGMASVVAGQCMALGGHPGVAGNDATGSVQVHDDSSDHGNAAHSHSDAHEQQAEDGGAGAHCGPCTACCGTASIASQITLAIAPLLSSTTYFFAPFPLIAGEPSSLERPPLPL